MTTKKKEATKKVEPKKKVSAKKVEPELPDPPAEESEPEAPKYSAWQLRHMQTRR